jgi:replication initiation protein RepC
METHIPTTPFGRRPLSLAILNGRRLSDECEPDAQADKWKLFRAVCEAKTLIGATDRALAVLNALLTFHREPELRGGHNLVVFPSNQQLALRAHGMAPATLRRHLAVLVDCGLIARRDSPNGKRFARKGQGGDIAQAYGFDLAPLLARAVEFERMADEVRTERQALHLMRERITLLRRDIAKMITFGIEEAIPAAWNDWHLQFRCAVARIPRTATREELRPVEAGLDELAEMIRNVLEVFEKSRNTSANESQTERHIPNSNPKSTFELEPGSRNEPGPPDTPDQPPYVQPQRSPKPKPPAGYPLSMVMRACPDIADYRRTPITDWNDLVETANLVRGALGVSPQAWSEACEIMGRVDAAIVVAAILQRSDQITSAGGYLRVLTDKARAGAFSVGPALMALLRARSRDDATKAG